MTFRREAAVIIRDPFSPTSPGDYVAPADAVRAALDVLAGTGDRLYDPRATRPLEGYHILKRTQEATGSVAILRHRASEHCLEITVRVTVVSSTVGAAVAASLASEVVASLSIAPCQFDDQDRGALESYVLLARRQEGELTIVKVQHRQKPVVLDVAIRVTPVPAEQAYRNALDQDEVWRANGTVVFDERHPRPAPIVSPGVHDRAVRAVMSEVLKVHPVQTNPWLGLVLVVCSFGLILPLWGLALLFDQRPKLLDAEGITTVRNKRFLWSELQEAAPHVEYRRDVQGRQRRVAYALRMKFSSGKLTITPATIVNGDEVLAFIERRLGRTFDR